MSLKALAVALAATTLISTGVLAADQAAKPTGAEQSAERDFGKLSTDGRMAIRDIRTARLAIFDGRTKEAKTDIERAKTALAKAKTGDTVFTKAEAALKAPPGTTQPAPDKTQPSSTPVTWIPVDGGLTLGEDFVATPGKTSGVANANARLKKGEHKQAMETLRMAGIDVSFVMEIAPLDKTVSGVDKAEQLIDAGKFYEADQALKSVEDGLRFDVSEMVGAPKKPADAMQKPASTSSAIPPAATPATPPAAPAPSK